MLRRLWTALSLACLALCLLAPVCRFLGEWEESQYKLVFLLASCGWFLFASLWSATKKG